MRQTVETGNGRFVFLDYLRALAAWAVVWNHMLATWPEQRGIHPLVVTAVRAWITQPPGVIQDFGWMAVAVFFLISGFIITHVAAREGVMEFLIKRLFRVFPLLDVFLIR